VAPDGSIYIVGSTRSFSASGDFDVFLVKYASDGTLLQQTYGTTGPGYPLKAGHVDVGHVR
jgi:hypothetical protein